MKSSSDSRVRSGAWIPVALLALSAIPVVAGASRLVELTDETAATPANARFFDAPLPIGVHIVTATVYAVVGAFQFAPALRRRRPDWHRRLGRVVAACGLVSGVSALWMTAFYPRVSGDGDLLDGFRYFFGAAMVAFLLIGVQAIRRGDRVRHGAFMTRAYAIGLGAGTQALVHIPWVLIHGDLPGELGRALLMGTGWALNLAVAEWIIRKPLGASDSSRGTEAYS